MAYIYIYLYHILEYLLVKTLICEWAKSAENLTLHVTIVFWQGSCVFTSFAILLLRINQPLQVRIIMFDARSNMVVNLL